MPGETGGSAAGDGRAPRRFLIVDPHQPLRQSLSRFIEKRCDGALCSEADCAVDALRLARERGPHVVIVDPCLGDADGFDSLRQMAAAVPGVRIVGYSLADDCRSVRRFLEAGGHGFASKAEPPEALLDAIEQALAGRIRIAYREDRTSQELRTETVSTA